MTEQTGNNKPNEAEGLAFPLSGNEKLIEEAAAQRYPHRNVFLEGMAYMSEERSRIPLREAFVEGAKWQAEKARTTTPPDGWFYMGSHVGAPWLNLEFSEEMDETGLPLWERPVQHTPTDDARAYADAEYPETPLAPENEESAEIAERAFLAGRASGMLRAARKALAAYDEHFMTRLLDPAEVVSLAEALRALITPPGIGMPVGDFRRSEEPETAPELFPGTLDALDSLTIRKEEA